MIADPERIVAGFARTLRAHGVQVPTTSAITYANALAAVDVSKRSQVYWAGRASLLVRPDDIADYDRAFSEFWERSSGAAVDELLQPVVIELDDPDADEDQDESSGIDDEAVETITVRYSSQELLRHRDFDSLSADEWAEVNRLISALQVTCELRPSRRHRPSRRRRSGPMDVRATFRRSLRTGGVPISNAWRSPVERPRRLVMLLDVSASMRPYSRALARFAHSAVASRRSGRVEIFTFGTRLTRITRQLSDHDADSALRSASSAVPDWSGGTRIGDNLREFNDLWGVRGLARGAVVVICSDGWDRGDPELVAAEMARLRRVARRVVWVNPLKASPGYVPLARGMAAALPHVDSFVEGDAITSLDALATLISGNRSTRRYPGTP